MYPLAPGLFAPKNAWYVAAWSSEITDKPLGRWFLNEPVVLYRKGDGEVVGLQGRCPHRHYPLSEGRRVGDNLQCGYHGMTFGPDGLCVSVPTQGAVSKACNIKAYPVAERWQWIWIWMGDPSLADETLIPDHDAIDLGNPEFDTFPKAYYHVNGRYMLLHDNLLDLTHLAFLHSTTIGNEETAAAKETRSQDSRTTTSRRIVRNVVPQPYFAALFNTNALVDRHFGSTFHGLRGDVGEPGLSAAFCCC